MSKPREFFLCDETDNSGWSVRPWSEKEEKRQFGACNVIRAREVTPLHEDLEKVRDELAERCCYGVHEEHKALVTVAVKVGFDAAVPLVEQREREKHEVDADIKYRAGFNDGQNKLQSRYDRLKSVVVDAMRMDRDGSIKNGFLEPHHSDEPWRTLLRATLAAIEAENNPSNLREGDE